MQNTKLFMVLFGIIMLFFAINAMGMDWTQEPSFSYELEQAMQVVEQKMMLTEDCFGAIGTRNQILCSIWSQNVLVPNFGKY